MNDLLLLKDKSSCPVCRAKSVGSYGGNCRNCGTRLFTSPINFKEFENETGITVWWFFNPDCGWMSRDHIMVADAKPLSRIYVPPKLDKNYGHQTTPDAVRSRGGKLKAKDWKGLVN